MSLALALVVPLLTALQSGVNEAHENEWTARRWALFPDSAQDELLAALDSKDWRERERALAALARSTKPLASEVKRAAAACLEFGHPSVKAATLDLLARTGNEVTLRKELGAELATSRLPEVRAALARMLGRSGGDSALLCQLAFDVDQRVREDARRALLGHFEGDAARAVLSSLAREGELGEYLQALDWARRRQQIFRTEASEGGEFEDVSRGRRALLAALELTDGTGESELTDEIFEAWFDEELDRPDARLFLSRIMSNLEPELAWLLVEFWMDLDRGESERWPAGVEACGRLGADAEDRRDDLLSLAMDALGPAIVVRRVSQARVTTAGRVSLIELAEIRLSSWEASIARGFLESGEPDVRSAILRALTHNRTSGDEVSVSLLLEVLQNGTPGERRLAFDFLCGVRDLESALEPLHRAWLTTAEPERIELLRELPRHVELIPFRRDLIELAQRGGETRDAVFDLLLRFRPDEELVELSLGWLEVELALALAGELGGPSAAERRAAGALRLAWLLSDESGRERISELALRVLRATAERSELISRDAVEILNQRDDRGALLPEFLAATTLEPTRIDVAIALASDGHVEATDVLRELIPGASLKAAFRMMSALGEFRSADVRFWLAESALDESFSSELRGSATRALSRWGKLPDVIGQLGGIALHAPDVETMADAIRGLASCGGASGPMLLRLLRVLEGDGDSRLADLEGDYLAMIRIELLNALAEVGGLSSELWSEVLERPMERAAEWFEARLRGAQTGKVEFEWRGELELFSRMMRRRNVADVLNATGEWWRLDGRFIAQLAEHDGTRLYARDVPAVIEMFRAALVALGGELRVDSEYVMRVRLDLLRILLVEERWEEAAHVADAIVADWREARIPDRVWSASLGTRSRLRGDDPAARLAALRWQLRGRQATQDGDLKRARESADRAEASLGFSREARELQDVLEVEIEALALRLSEARSSASDD